MMDFRAGLLRYLSEQQLQAIEAQTIGIAGAGGLGSNLAMLLVRCGFRKFILTDFDEVAVSNLNRQNYFLAQAGKPKLAALEENLRAIRPDLELRTVAGPLGPENWQQVFAQADLLAEAFDEAGLKKSFAESFAGQGRFLVTVSGIAGYWDSDRIRTRWLGPKLCIIGDEVSDIDAAPPLAPAVMIAAAKEADAVLSYVLEGEKHG